MKQISPSEVYNSSAGEENSQSIRELEQPATGPYPEPVQSVRTRTQYYLRFVSIVSSHLVYISQMVSFHKIFRLNFVYI
jgi:hypothetical protein